MLKPPLSQRVNKEQAVCLIRNHICLHFERFLKSEYFPLLRK